MQRTKHNTIPENLKFELKKEQFAEEQIVYNGFSKISKEEEQRADKEEEMREQYKDELSMSDITRSGSGR